MGPIERIWKEYRSGDESPADTLRRVFLEGKLTEDNFIRKKGVGKKGTEFLFFLLGLKTEKSVRSSKP